MASNIVLKTFAAGDDGQGTVTPQDDALIYQNAIPMNGIFSGAAVTLSEANVLHVAAGFGIIGGRFFEINESDITVELSSSGTLLGRLYIHLELTNADVPISINVVTGASLPALVGDPDLNINDGTFDLELATFNVSEVTISDLVNTFPTISKANNQLRRATAYLLNDMAFCQSASDALIFMCTTAGTTAVQQPTGYATITDGNTITDGTAVFKAVSVSGILDNIVGKADQSLLAPVLSTLVAPAGGLAIGDQFIYNGLLYKATAAIAQGGTITINGNCELTDNVTEQLKNLILWRDVEFTPNDRTISAQSVKDFTTDMSYMGYTFIGCIGFVIGSGGQCSVVNCYKSSNTTAKMRVYNPLTSSYTLGNLIIQGLYIKN